MLQDLIPRKSYIQHNGDDYLYDTLRHKWLSVKRRYVSFYIKRPNATGDRWLYYNNIPSNLTGYQATTDYIITFADAFSNTPTIGSLQVLIDNEIKTSLDFSSEIRKESLLDIPLLDGNKLGVKLVGRFDYPTINLELALRR